MDAVGFAHIPVSGSVPPMVLPSLRLSNCIANAAFVSSLKGGFGSLPNTNRCGTREVNLLKDNGWPSEGSPQKHSCCRPLRPNESQPRHVTAVWSVVLRSHRLLYLAWILGNRKIFPQKSRRGKKGGGKVVKRQSHVGRARSEFCWSFSTLPTTTTTTSVTTQLQSAVGSSEAPLPENLFGERVTAGRGCVK